MFPEPADESAGAARLHDGDLEDEGYVMDLTRVSAWRPDVCEAFMALRAQPDWQLAAAAPAEVMSAVSFGRPPASREQ